MENAHQVLRDVFGHEGFRLSQEAVIKRLLVDNENALVLYPTGGGKSLTYQVPALCLEGLTLVISPLLALMKDQVDALCDRGVKAANLDSTLSMEKSAFVKAEVLNGNLKLLYVAPERLNNEGFVEMMKRVKISLLAVDESHCISQWGASFRPDYLKIARFAEEMDVERVLCLTATGTKKVAEDICKSFFIHEQDGVFRTSVFRSNLAFQVQVATNLHDKVSRLVPFLKARTGPAIVYVTLQRHADEVANHLRRQGLNPMVYHAGLPNEERQSIQKRFMESDDGIVCATIAFGMGIDKGHSSLYAQDTGGIQSRAPDIPILEGFCRGDTCSEKDLQLWMQEVALKQPAKDGTLDFNHYQQAKDYDIRSNVLGLCYAQLELDFGYIRAVTPFYSIYALTARSAAGWNKVLADKSNAANTVRRYWSPKGSTYTIDVVTAAVSSGTDRTDLAKVISNWELEGLVTAKASQVRARYTVLNALPKSTEEIKNVANMIYQRMVEREEEAIQKLHQVIAFATGEDCLAQNLANYFGDTEAVPGGLCGLCTFCQTAEAVQFEARANTEVDKNKLKEILNACPERDDPRLLARMAFGITSPRLTYIKCSTSHSSFGCMDNVDFNVLIAAFDEECKKAGYTKSVSYTAPKTSSNKRSFASSSNYSRGKRGKF